MRNAGIAYAIGQERTVMIADAASTRRSSRLLQFRNQFTIGDLPDADHTAVTSCDDALTIRRDANGVQKVTTRRKSLDRFAVAAVADANLAVGTGASNLIRCRDKVTSAEAGDGGASPRRPTCEASV